MNLMEEYENVAFEWDWGQTEDKRWIFKLSPKCIKTLCKVIVHSGYCGKRSLQTEMLEKKLKQKYLGINTYVKK